MIAHGQGTWQVYGFAYMFKRFLVPLDGSMLAELALEPALHLAQQADGIVYLMRVPIYIDSGAQSSPEYQRVWVADNDIPEHEDVTAYLRETRENILRPGVSVRTIVGEGDRANAVLNTAVARNVDLIVMASHARSGVSRWLLGSVSGKVIPQAQSPVMLIRQPSDFNHILITLDGSKLAEHVIEPTLALAAGFGSRITFLQVKDDKEEEPAAGASDANVAVASEITYLDRILSQYKQRGLQVDAVTVNGPVASNILSYAAQNNVDLIAMSTTGRSGLRKLIFGSMTEKIMCESGCAMLIISPTDQASS